ncbi:MAG: GGDEF domain-containing protein, partial [Pseudorhodoplanes sp.]
MSLQGPIVVVGEQHSTALIDAISAAGAFPVIESNCAEAAAAITAANPSAIVLTDSEAACDDTLANWLTREITRKAPIVPVIACAVATGIPAYRESLWVAQADPQAVAARITSALRVRSLHAALLRRAEIAKAAGQHLPRVPDTDPLDDATVILAGRGRSYP